MRRLGVLLLAVVSTVVPADVLAGCGDRGSVPAGAVSSAAGDVPITRRAIAATALEHAPDDTTSRGALFILRSDNPSGTIGVELGYRGWSLEVKVSPGSGPADICRKYDHDGCDSDDVDGGVLTLWWQEIVPEADPGRVSVAMQRPDETVTVSLAGEKIEGDPRKQDLPISIDAMEDIARDARISLTTGHKVVDAGAALDGWHGRS